MEVGPRSSGCAFRTDGARLRAVRPGPDQEVSEELRRAEIEVRFPADLNAEHAQVEAVLLAHVYEGVDGACVYRRIPLTIQFPVASE